MVTNDVDWKKYAYANSASYQSERIGDTVDSLLSVFLDKSEAGDSFMDMIQENQMRQAAEAEAYFNSILKFM